MKRLSIIIITLMLLAGCGKGASPAGTCTLKIDCSTITDNIDLISEEKAAIIPKDGIVYYSNTVSVYENDTVFDILKMEMQSNNIPFEFSSSPTPGSEYIQGIANIYEFDCGSLSGWEFTLNGQFQSLSCGSCPVSDGDEIVWYYTCDMGQDIGAEVAD